MGLSTRTLCVLVGTAVATLSALTGSTGPRAMSAMRASAETVTVHILRPQQKCSFAVAYRHHGRLYNRLLNRSCDAQGRLNSSPCYTLEQGPCVTAGDSLVMLLSPRFPAEVFLQTPTDDDIAGAWRDILFLSVMLGLLASAAPLLLTHPRVAPLGTSPQVSPDPEQPSSGRDET